MEEKEIDQVEEKEKRKILFRGKCKANGLWYYGFLYKDCFILGGDEDDMYGEYHDTIDKTWIDTYMSCVDPKTVGQFTGLYDKNGKEIFEGDIIKESYDVYTPYYTVVTYDAPGFVGTKDYRHCCNYETDELRSESKYFEIIGNIHDNPELLEVE